MQFLPLMFVAAISITFVSFLTPMIQTLTQNLLVANELAWLNPGNTLGLLTEYAVIGFVICAIAASVRHIKQVSLRIIFWWFGAVTLVSAAFLVANFTLSTFINTQFGFLAAVLVSSLVCVQITRLKFPEYSFSSYVRGARLTTSKTIKEKRGEIPMDHLILGADHVDQKDETKHMLIVGNVGAGKSTFISCLMAAVANRANELWIVFDAKAELVPMLKALGKELIILNPLDTRSSAWHMRKDINNVNQAATFSNSLIPEEKNNENYWSLSARNLLIAVILFFIDSGLDWDLRDILLACSDIHDLKFIINQDPKNRVLSEGLTGGNSQHGGNDYALTLNNRLRPFQVIASLWHTKKECERISLSEIVQSKDFHNTAIVFGTDYSSGPTLNTLNQLLFERLTQIMQNLSEDRNRRIRLWLDEITEASRYTGDSLVRFLTLARSKGGSVTMGAQNFSGLVDKFGKEKATQIVGLAHYKALVGGVDGATAQWYSRDVIGEEEVIEVHLDYPQAPGKVSREKDAVRDQSLASEGTPTYKRVTRPLVPKEALLNSAIPSTGPENGLTGFFSGGPGGSHWHHYSWKQIKAMQVEPDKSVPAYDRISERDSAYNLPGWTPAERSKWGLPPIKSHLTEEEEYDAA